MSLQEKHRTTSGRRWYVRVSKRWASHFLMLLCVWVSTSAARAQPLLSVDALFALSVCNKTNVQVSVSLLHAHPTEENTWFLSGWFNVEASECRKIGDFPRGYVYLYAHQNGGTLQWGGNDRFICVSQRPVRRMIFDNERCLAGEANRGFTERLIKDAEFTWNLTR